MELQEPSQDIWDKKYRLRAGDGSVVDQSPDDTLRRVAKAIAEVESEEARGHWEEQFLWALQQGAVPAGRILSNAGAGEHKPSTSLINCTVSETIEDSMRSILERNMAAGLTLKSGAGIGYEFSTLRPSGALVSGAGASTSGPLPFMDMFDGMCKTVSSAGGRRGAQMATFDVGHPDVFEFIRAKREDGRLRQFNLSLLITEPFINSVEGDLNWDLAFPASQRDMSDGSRIIWREWPITDGYTVDAAGRVAMKVYKTVRARELWDTIMASTYDFAEPGFILIDNVNEMNNNWFCESIRATNPCGEQPLPPGGSCLLGSINLTMFVRDPFTENASFDWETFEKVVRIFTRMLDNVVEINGLPLQIQRDEIASKRRHGMGYFGLGSALAMMCTPYGSAPSLEFTELVTFRMAKFGWEEAVNLSLEKGPAPILTQEFDVTTAMLAKRPEMAADGYKVGDRVPGRILHARYSRYMQRLAEREPDLVKQLEEVGARFTHHTSIAPTGTIALSLGNNASNGIEPSFSHAYKRNVIREGRKTKEQIDVLSYEFLCYRAQVDGNANPEKLPAYFTSADSIDPKAHVDVQAAAQKWVDSSISKTINVPTDYRFSDFEDIYLYAVRKGLKGCTTFRFNPAAFQGVLVKESDLDATTYEFVLEDGTVIEAKGTDRILYDGEMHNASNLFDAIKEGTYGKF